VGGESRAGRFLSLVKGQTAWPALPTPQKYIAPVFRNAGHAQYSQTMPA
jgi:hypothetical protein